ncbi:MAG: hypothetical protein ACO3K7_05910 [Candidatus Marinamargulisbacteria bacterium]
MSEELNVQEKMSQDLQLGKTIAPKDESRLNDELVSILDQVFDLIFDSSKQVLGNIRSIGLKYGDNLSQPDHMLVVFPDIVYGFESWNNQQEKSLWKYQRSNKIMSKNGRDVTLDDQDSFAFFVQKGLDAMGDQSVSFSKNITKKEIQSIR